MAPSTRATPSWGLPAKCSAMTFCPSRRRLTAKAPLASSRGKSLAFLAIPRATRGGSRLKDMKAVAVMPLSSPWRAETTVTPAAKRLMASLKASFTPPPPQRPPERP
jgi:hypothetical protein